VEQAEAEGPLAAFRKDGGGAAATLREARKSNRMAAKDKTRPSPIPYTTISHPT